MENKLNGKPITTSHGFSCDEDSFFSSLGVSVGDEKIAENHYRQICEYYNVIRIESRTQGLIDKFFNGTAYEFFTLDYILERLKPPTVDGDNQ